MKELYFGVYECEEKKVKKDEENINELYHFIGPPRLVGWTSSLIVNSVIQSNLFLAGGPGWNSDTFDSQIWRRGQINFEVSLRKIIQLWKVTCDIL